MADDKETSVQAHENTAAQVPLTKKRKCAQHCKRFWWAYLIAFICIVVLVVCLM